jgi:ArsR family transcriptional regulator, arsenate/arsenite/antimonite-responsive transcriptional repressor
METTSKDKSQLPTKQALGALAALSQETRLGIYRLLVEIGPQGLHVGAIAERLSLANATLSFHLKELANAGLIVAAPNGRTIIYSANFSTMNALIAYLTENCCAGATCATTVACKPAAGKTAPVTTVTKRKTV